MHIANPIYDVVFKYLMDDSKVAKLLLSTIIGEEIIELHFLPQENIAEVDRPDEMADGIQLERPPLTVYKLDFSATIHTLQGDKHIIIEIQKAKYATDLMRFRKYLGEQYQKTHPVTINDEAEEKALPILSIYFLGHTLAHTCAPLIKVQRHYIDVATQSLITQKEDFIETLTHDSFIIQIPYLRSKYQSEAEQLLRIFDQRQQISGNHHLLNINEDDYPETYQPLIRRLFRAVAEPKIRKTMDIEDEVLAELEALDRKVAGMRETLEAKDQALVEKDQVIMEKNQVIVEKDQVIVEKDQALIEKDQVIAEEKANVAEEKAKREALFSKAMETLILSGLSEDDARKSLTKHS